MNIEKLRMDYPFDHQIEVDKGLNPGNIYVPPLTLQPFVENSIWHGFIHKNEAGSLVIKCSITGGDLHIEIIDDGVGRAKSQQLERSLQKSRSYGILITKERLLRSQEGKDLANQFQITDLFDENNVGIGTKVEIRIPINTTKVINP